MELSSYALIIIASLAIIVSYFFNILSKKTNIPSVVMLILLGILLNESISFFNLKPIDWFPILEILGIVGLIMIVLEASLDLKLSKEKIPLIVKSFLLALFSIGINIFLIAKVFQVFYDISIFRALLYATPLSIISSAIIIPSVSNLSDEFKEFMIYESTFSDILGIMAFYFILGSVHQPSQQAIHLAIGTNILITIVSSVVISYGLIFLFQRIRSEIKLFLLIATLILFYALGKMFHLSSLIIILVFGLILENKDFFLRPFIKHIDNEAIEKITKNLKIITFETSFVIRTFFFIIFGITISFAGIFNLKVWLISFLALVIIYGSRYGLLALISRHHLQTKLLLAPRGLISILLFYAIPKEYQIEEFNHGTLLLVIFTSAILMTIALIKHKHKTEDSVPTENETTELIDESS
jgi:NhaP-type Na+/H+ or K+/H+ antiporter